MKLARIIAAAIVAAALPLVANADELKIMSYNVHNVVGLDEVRSADRIGQLIKKHDPDIVAIQEVDSMTKRSGEKYVLGDIAAAAGMQAYYGPAIDYNGGQYGIGILSKEEPISISRRQLPGREEQRTIIVAEFPDYIFAATHFSLTAEDRLASAAIVKQMAKEAGKPFFLAGDLNAHPDDDVISSLSEDFTILTPTDKFTFPADKPNETLDYIMVDKQGGSKVKRKGAKIIKEPKASDHRPITATVELLKQEQK